MIKFAKYEEAVAVLKKALKLDETNAQAQELMEKAEAGKKRVDYGIPKDKLKGEKQPSAPPRERPKAEKPTANVPPAAVTPKPPQQ